MAAVQSQQGPRQGDPQAFISSYAPRLRQYGNSLIAPIIPQATAILPSRTTKRGTTAINYAEDGYDDEEFYESEAGVRRPTGLRSLRRDDSNLDKPSQISKLGKELKEPIHLQGVWRDWMGKPRRVITRKQCEIQAELPVTLIPIRIDLEVQPFRPEAPLPTPPNARDYGIDESLPVYRVGDLTPLYRIKDIFMWNLHESLITPDSFARTLVDELDLPGDKKPALTHQIAVQIRTQLEEHAGIALHPLFQGALSTPAAAKPTQKAISLNTGFNTPQPNGLTNGITNGASTPAPESQQDVAVSASAQMSSRTHDDTLNPDDSYRCVIGLNVNILNKLYSDKFEWSLLHPIGYAETFARITCADLGLAPEWVSAIAHAIYEAVLRLKKEVCENGGVLGAVEIENDAAEGVEAGWRYEPEALAEEWEPKVETLSKDEIEKRERDRERQIRIARRETARFSGTAGVGGASQDYAGHDASDQPLGRGERSKKKRRFRSLSPSGRDTPDASGSHGGGTGLQDNERQAWRCAHCHIPGAAVWAVRSGPAGPRSLCHNCGLLFERDGRLPPWSKNLYGTSKKKTTGPK